MARPQHPVADYFQNIWDGIVSTYLGMKLTLTYFFRKKVTMSYPEVRPTLPAAHRGMHVYGEDACTICRACETICPVQCITLDAIGKGRTGMKTSYRVDYSKCLFCNLCVEACKPECLSLGAEFDLATLEKDDCTIEFARSKSPEERAAFEAELARKDAERKAKAEAERLAKAAEVPAPGAAPQPTPPPAPVPERKETP